MSNKGGNKREKFLESVRKQKLDTVRWSLGAGGQSPSVRDDEGYTSIMPQPKRVSSKERRQRTCLIHPVLQHCHQTITIAACTVAAADIADDLPFTNTNSSTSITATADSTSSS